MTDKDPQQTLARAQRVLNIEAGALIALSNRLDASFHAACALILACHGRLIVTGMGKSGHVARKIAATMASTGTPAFFVHPGEAAHGDLGMITSQDVVLALSNSGESDELVTLLPSLSRLGVPLIAMTGNPDSTMGQECHIHLYAGVDQEACPLNLAPTASTTAALALGDALAVVLLEERGFRSEDFARSHPGGSLGRRLLIHVRDIMHDGDQLPVVEENVALKDALLEMSRKGLGMTAVVNATGALQGVLTDGDLRRALDRDVDVRVACVADVMTRSPVTIDASRLAAEAAQIMETRRINGLLVMADDQLVGALNMHDLLRARVV